MSDNDLTAALTAAIRSIDLPEQMMRGVEAQITLRRLIDSIEVRDVGVAEIAALHRLSHALHALCLRAAVARNDGLAKLAGQGQSVADLARATGIDRVQAWKLIGRANGRNR